MNVDMETMKRMSECVARKFCPDDAEARDAMAGDIWSRLWEHGIGDAYRSLPPEQVFRLYFGKAKILGMRLRRERHRARMNKARLRQHAERFHPLQSRGEISPANILEEKEEAALLNGGLAKLDPDDVLLLRLRYMDGLAFRKLGTACGGVSHQTARAREARAIEKLRTLLLACA